MLEKPFCTQEGLELPGWMVRQGTEEAEEKGDKDEETQAEEAATGAESRVIVSYDSRPPVWAAKICVT